MKILIVDDNADDRRVLRYNLENHGCKDIIEAQDGQEGLDLAKAQNPDLIISDALMPAMDGFQFLRSVKTDETLKSIPFVFYSAVYTGYREAELATSLGAEAFIIKPQDPDELWAAVSAILEECKLRKSNGLSAALLEEEEDFLRKYSHIVAAKLEEKVGELEKTKLQLIATRDRLEHLVSQSPSVIYSLDSSDAFVTFISENVVGLLGYAVWEIMETPLFLENHVHPDDVLKVRQNLATIHKQGRITSEYRFRHKDGSYRWLRQDAKAVKDDNGAVIEIICSLIDITEQKLAEEQLYLTAQRLRLATQSALIGIWDLDLKKKVLIWDDRMYQLYGIRPEDFDGAYEAWEKGVHPEDVAAARAAVKEAIAGRDKFHSQFRVVWPDGQVHHIEAHAIVQHGPDGAPQRMIGVNWDISERRKLENELRESQKMESIGLLAGGIAHDFNNILSAIIGYGHIALMKMAKDDPQRLNIESMLEGADRAAHLTKDLLLFSRKQVSERKAVDPNAVVGKIEKFLRKVIGEDIECKTMLQDQPIPVYADNHQLEQVLMNLATNARDAMPEGGTFTVTIEQVVLNEDFVSAHGYGGPGAYAMITVSDTGKGMDEATRTRIFEPFFTTKEVGKGTGLGLAVVYGIIKQHDGLINVYSEPGKGTTFRIYLPITKSAAGEEAMSRQEEAPARGTETILLAEDDESLRKLSQTVLTDFGYTVIEAVDGEDAVRKFTEYKEPIQLLLFDLIMPNMNGKEAYDEIRKIKPDIKIIFASGYAPDIIRQKASLEDGVHLIYKPMSPMALLRKVRSVLDGAK